MRRLLVDSRVSYLTACLDCLCPLRGADICTYIQLATQVIVRSHTNIVARLHPYKTEHARCKESCLHTVACMCEVCS